MRTSDFGRGRAVRALEFGPRDVPHMTLETNRTCNMRCRACYNHDRTTVKSLAEVKADLDAGQALRKLAAVTILGGEPTLYPELVEVVAEVKRRGLFCALLTNGLRFLDPDGPALIGRLRDAGVDRIYVHIDSGQSHVHPDIETAREKAFALLEAAGVPFALSVTVYDWEDADLAGILKRYSRFRYFGGILAVLGYDADAKRALCTDPAPAYRGLGEAFGLEPHSFIPADRDGGEVRWLNYLYLINARTGRTLPITMAVERLYEKISRRGEGSLFFSCPVGPEFVKRSLAALVVAGLVAAPKRAMAFLRGARRRDVRAQFVVIQVSPELDYDAGRASICRWCPDATVRGGKLVPVCLADIVRPLDRAIAPQFACPEI